jgi:hypothetical protein
VLGGTARARSEWESHAAAPASQGGEQSWSWAAVSLSMTTMGPPHGDNAKVDSVAWRAKLLVRIAMAGLGGGVESKAAGERRGGGWQEAEVVDHPLVFVVVSGIAPAKR